MNYSSFLFVFSSFCSDPNKKNDEPLFNRSHSKYSNYKVVNNSLSSCFCVVAQLTLYKYKDKCRQVFANTATLAPTVILHRLFIANAA